MPPANARPMLAVALVAGVLLILALWFISLLRRANTAAPLRRMVDAGSVTGVEKRYRTRNPEVGRRLLVSMGSTPALLVPQDSHWYILSGEELSVARHCPVGRGVCKTPADEGDPGAVPVEFTAAGRPQMRRRGSRRPSALSPATYEPLVQGLRELPADQAGRASAHSLRATPSP